MERQIEKVNAELLRIPRELEYNGKANRTYMGSLDSTAYPTPYSY